MIVFVIHPVHSVRLHILASLGCSSLFAHIQMIRLYDTAELIVLLIPLQINLLRLPPINVVIDPERAEAKLLSCNAPVSQLVEVQLRYSLMRVRGGLDELVNAESNHGDGDNEDAHLRSACGL